MFDAADTAPLAPVEQPQAAPAAAAPAEDNESVRRLVGEWVSKIKDARDKTHKAAFERMKRNMYIANHGCTKDWKTAGKYKSNIIGRYCSRKTAELYAKNPTVVVKRAQMIEGNLWDGRAESLQAAMQTIQPPMPAPAAPGEPPAPPPPPPQMDPMFMASMAIIQEAGDILQRRAAVDKFARTVQLVVQRSWDRRFKSELKQAVRRASTCGVAYIYFDIFRETDYSPDIKEQIADTRTRMKELEQLQREAARLESDESAPTLTKLKLSLDDLMGQEMITLREGIIYGFPGAQNVIIDPDCYQIRGFMGASWLAIQDDLTPRKIEAIYGIDITGADYAGGTPKAPPSTLYGDNSSTGPKKVCVWRVFDKDLQQEFVVCDGYDGFLKEPNPPVAFRKGFWPLIPIIFNEQELPENEIFPQSDVDLLYDAQDELNKVRQGLRQHRQANRPIYIAPKRFFTEREINNINDVETHGIIMIEGMEPGQKSTDVLVPVQKTPIDPGLYDVQGIMLDFQMVGGQQDANLGAVSGGTATESSIAESSRTKEASEDVDSLDESLSECAAEVAVMAVNGLILQTVQEMAGPGAVWPHINREQLVESFDTEIKAGSSGRPNQAAELANFERAMPTLIQIPGINPQYLAEELLKRLNDDLDVTDALAMLPSITAINAMMSKPPAPAPGAEGAGAEPGLPASDDPAAQGVAGGSGVPAPPGVAQGPQPAYGDSGALPPV